MRVSDIMERKLVTITTDATLGEAIALLADRHISALPVLSLHGPMVGVLSTSDVLQAEAEARTTRRTELFENTLVRDLMSAHPLTVAPSATVHEAAQQLLYSEVHRLFVVDNGELVGVISQTDIVRAVANARDGSVVM